MSHPQHALPSGFELMWYQIKSILGQGGFAFTYLAEDKNLHRSVAVKEFMPTDLVVRDPTDYTLKPNAGDGTELFTWGLNRFRHEARTLAQFNHRNIVRVLSVFDQNNTAYMVMEYEEGDALSELLEARKEWEQDELLSIINPIVDGLDLVHQQGFIHRDIKPSNIYIRADGSPVLLDFGSARPVQNGGAKTQSLTSLVTHGFAPFEQYSVQGQKQGPWTDIYGLGATLYRAVTGRKPPDAMSRANAYMGEVQDEYIPAAKAISGKHYSPEFLAAIDAALNFKSQDRPQSIVEWGEMLNGSRACLPLILPPHQSPDAAQNDVTRIMTPEQRSERLSQRNSHLYTTYLNEEESKKSKLPLFIYGGVSLVALIAIAVILVVVLPKQSGNLINSDVVNDTSKPSKVTVAGTENNGEDEALKPKINASDLQALIDQVEWVNGLGSMSTEDKFRESYPLYQKILEIDPSNEFAEQGVNSIYQEIRKNGRDFITQGELEKAEEQKLLLEELGASSFQVDLLSALIEDAKVRLASQTATPEPTPEPQPKATPKPVVAQPTAKPVVKPVVKAVPKPAPSKPKLVPSMNNAIEAIGKFKDAFENRRSRDVYRYASLNNEQKKLFSGLMQNYAVIRTEISNFEYLKTKNMAKATLTITHLVDSNENVFSAADPWREMNLICKFNEYSGWKINVEYR